MNTAALLSAMLRAGGLLGHVRLLFPNDCLDRSGSEFAGFECHGYGGIAVIRAAADRPAGAA